MRVLSVCVVFLFAAAALVEATAIREPRSNGRRWRLYKNRAPLDVYEEAEGVEELTSPEITNAPTSTARDLSYDDVVIDDDESEPQESLRISNQDEEKDGDDGNAYNENENIQAEEEEEEYDEYDNDDNSIYELIRKIEQHIRQEGIDSQRAEQRRRLLTKRRNAAIKQRNRERQMKKRWNQMIRRQMQWQNKQIKSGRKLTQSMLRKKRNRRRGGRQRVIQA